MTGCSAVSAFSGTPDIASLRTGMSKDEVEDIIDDVSTVRILEGDRREVVYSYIEKDSSIFRGIGYLLGSAITFLLFEPAFWRWEMRRSHKNYAFVVYDKNDKVVSLQTQQGVLPAQRSEVDFTYRER